MAIESNHPLSHTITIQWGVIVIILYPYFNLTTRDNEAERDESNNDLTGSNMSQFSCRTYSILMKNVPHTYYE